MTFDTEPSFIIRASLAAQLAKNLPAMRETWVQPLGWEDPLEKGMATHSSILTWKFHGVYSPWGRRESYTIEQLSLFIINRISGSFKSGKEKVPWIWRVWKPSLKGVEHTKALETQPINLGWDEPTTANQLGYTGPLPWNFVRNILTVRAVVQKK